MDLPATKFEWKDKSDNFYKVEEMETRHLFFTVRMLWNHSVPDDFKLYPYKQYSFSAFYSKDYVREAIRCMLHELSTRNNIMPKWENDLDYMARVLRDRFESKIQQPGQNLIPRID